MDQQSAIEKTENKGNASQGITIHETALAKRGINEAQWRTLINNLYPGARPESVLMVWDYCMARKLDPMKKPCHIVPMEVKDSKTGEYAWRDVVMPGVYELRTTAQRTGLYMGHSKPEYGPMVEYQSVRAPEWCEMTFFRKVGDELAQYPVRVYFEEVVGTNKKGDVNARWRKAPIQMLTKCTEAAGLREAFPEELGGEHAAEELDGKVLNAEVVESQAEVSTAKRTERLKEKIKTAKKLKEAPQDLVTATEEKPETQTVTSKNEQPSPADHFKKMMVDLLNRNPVAFWNTMAALNYQSIEAIQDDSEKRLHALKVIGEAVGK